MTKGRKAEGEEKEKKLTISVDDGVSSIGKNKELGDHSKSNLDENYIN